MFEHFRDDARRALARAQQEAQRYRHPYVGTEHLLLGIASAPGFAAEVMAAWPVTLRDLRRELAKVAPQGPEDRVPEQLPQTAHGREVIEKSIAAARQLHDSEIGPEHLLLAVLEVREGHGAVMLADLGFHVDVLAEQLRQALEARRAETS